MADWKAVFANVFLLMDLPRELIMISSIHAVFGPSEIYIAINRQNTVILEPDSITKLNLIGYQSISL